MTASLSPLQEHSSSELLPWMFVPDAAQQIVVCKDSSLLAAWQMEGVDIESGSELDAAAVQFDGVLRRLADTNATVWATMERRPVESYIRGSFDNGVADYIDRVWSETFERAPVYANKVFFAASMPTAGSALSLGESVGEYIGSGDKLPVAIAKALKGRLKKGQNIGFRNRQELDRACQRFENNVAQLVDHALFEVRTQRLTGAGLLGYLKSTASVNPLAPVGLVEDEYLDTYLSDTLIDNSYQDHLVGDGLKRKYIGVFTLKNAPPGSMMQSLNALSALSIHLRVNMCWRSATTAQAERFLSAARTFDEMRGFTPRKLIKAAMAKQEAMGDDAPKTALGVVAEDYRQLLKRREAFFGWMAASVVILADSPEQLEDEMEIVARRLEQSGLIFIRERDGSLSGFCNGIPGHIKEVVRWHFVEAGNATDLMPLVSLDSGVPYHPVFSQGQSEPLPPNAILRTRYNTVQYFNYHFGELGHTLLIGPSRNGKTMFQMFLTAQFMKYPNARVFILDKDLSCRPPALMLGGEHINLDPEKGAGVRLNPVSIAKTDSGRAWLVGWLDRLLSSRGAPLTDRQIEEISQAITRICTDPKARLSTLNTQLSDDLRARLAPWCEGGAFGMYFDHSEDQFSFGRITCTEVGTLINAGLHDVVRAYCDYAFYRIELSLTGRSEAEVGPTMIYFEEAGFLLEHPIFAARARDYLMTLAKKRAFLVMTAQSPEPFINQPELGAAVRDNVATVIFLPNSKAVTASLAKQYVQAFGVNDTQLDLIASAVPKMEYCVFQLQANFFRVCRAQFPPEIVACLRSDAKSQAIFDRYYDPEDAQWRDKYLDAVLHA